MATVVGEKEVQEEKAEVKAASFNIGTFLGEVRGEYNRISWPSKDQVVREFFSVLVLVTVLTGTIFIIDKSLEFVLNFFSGK